MRRSLGPFRICPVVLGFFCANAYGQVGITGKVVDETGAAVSGARVELRLAVEDRVVAASSDLAGNFSMLLPKAGDYFIHALRQGFFELREGPHPMASGTSSLTVTLNHQT